MRSSGGNLQGVKPKMKNGRMTLGPALANALASRDKPPETLQPKAEKELTKSLCIPNDKRYTEIKSFSKGPAPSMGGLLASSMTGQDALEFLQKREAEEGAREAAAAEAEQGGTPRSQASGTPRSQAPGTPRSQAPIGAQGSFGLRCGPPPLAERPEWQETMDRKIKRLMVDFDLSDVPSCRLNHLDRMHNWLTNFGGGIAQSAAPGSPGYLTANRNSRQPLPAGSTSNIPVGLHPTTEMLKTMYSPRYHNRSPRAADSRPVTRG
mmetsp:Transcript_101131/g.182532  ORF Transcript_101131/g.182532 Transcript_101131/m.182532 type:complete len:265 (-) Transcript_101131:130-924(-)